MFGECGVSLEKVKKIYSLFFFVFFGILAVKTI